MTIKIQAYQRNGIKSDKVEEEFEFCCWDELFRWLKGYKGLNKCPECMKKFREECKKAGLLFDKEQTKSEEKCKKDAVLKKGLVNYILKGLEEI